MANNPNPFQPGFAPPSRGEWSRRTLWWLKRNAGLDRKAIASMLSVTPHRITCLCSPSSNEIGHWWFPELLGALVLGWRPNRPWAELDSARQGIVDEAILGVLDGSEAEFDKWLPVGTRWWRQKIFDGDRATKIPTRLAVVADALVDRAIPCGLPFGEWGA